MEPAGTTNDIKDTLRSWIAIDDQVRSLKSQIKALNDQKVALGTNVLEFMQGNNVDNFMLEGAGGTISRSVRTVRPPLRRQAIRTQLLLQFADQPQRVAEALRAIEGVQEGDDMSVGGTQRVVLARRLPRTQHITLQ
jgi:predicted AAA+ superfamily ATPase